MCQLFALHSNVPTAANFAFTGFSARGGATDHHADGWGMAFHDGERCRVFRGAAPACDSPLAELLRRQPFRARTVIAHVRKATQGPVALDNCHPFVRRWGGRRWVFAHNGDLKDFDPTLDGPHRPLGDTDSERAFCWLLQRMQRRWGDGPAPAWQQMAPPLADWAAELASHGPFNLLLGDGRALYAHASTRLWWLARQHPFARVRLVDRDMELDLASANAAGDRMVLVATAPLTANEPWQAFGAGESRLFVDGASVWQRTTETRRHEAAAEAQALAAA